MWVCLASLLQLVLLLIPSKITYCVILWAILHFIYINGGIIAWMLTFFIITIDKQGSYWLRKFIHLLSSHIIYFYNYKSLTYSRRNSPSLSSSLIEVNHSSCTSRSIPSDRRWVRGPVWLHVSAGRDVANVKCVVWFDLLANGAGTP